MKLVSLPQPKVPHHGLVLLAMNPQAAVLLHHPLRLHCVGARKGGGVAEQHNLAPSNSASSTRTQDFRQVNVRSNSSSIAAPQSVAGSKKIKFFLFGKSGGELLFRKEDFQENLLGVILI